jgi:hypothetical protein
MCTSPCQGLFLTIPKAKQGASHFKRVMVHITLSEGFLTIPKAKQEASRFKRVMVRHLQNKQTPILIHRHSLFLKFIERKEFNQNKASRAENNKKFLYSQK